MRRALACTLTALTLALGAGAGTASAQGPVNQTGLVNVNVGDVTVQVPIAVAANICGVNVAALAVDVAQFGQATCDALSTATVPATVTPSSGGPVNQTGLVNVHVGNVTPQLPVSVAANVCGLNVAVLAVNVLQGVDVTCTATGQSGG